MEVTAVVSPDTDARQVLIDKELEKARQAFTDWLKEPGHQRSLELPFEALCVLLPKRVYEISKCPPSDLEVSFYSADPGALGFMICDPGSSNSPFDRSKYIADIYLATDPMTPLTLQVGSIEVSRNFRRQKIAGSFYDNLAEVAREMGFRFVFGQNNPENVTYFTRKLGRSIISNIRPDLRRRIISPNYFKKHPGADPKFCTVEFLYPEDK